MLAPLPFLNTMPIDAKILSNIESTIDQPIWFVSMYFTLKGIKIIIIIAYFWDGGGLSLRNENILKHIMSTPGRTRTCPASLRGLTVARKLIRPKNIPISERTSMEIRNKCDLGGLGGLAAIYIVHIIEIVARKLRRIILFHSGLVTFRFLHWNLHPLIFKVLGPGGRDHDCQHQYYLSSHTPGHSK